MGCWLYGTTAVPYYPEDEASISAAAKIPWLVLITCYTRDSILDLRYGGGLNWVTS